MHGRGRHSARHIFARGVSPTRLVATAALTALTWGSAGCSDTDDTRDVERITEAAEGFCPPMWEYVKAVGATFNEASSDVGGLATGAERRERWLRALDDIELLVVEIDWTASEWRDDPVIGALVAEVERDAPAAVGEIDGIRALFDDRPELDEERHQVRTQQVIVRLEKVIDLPKPDLAPNDPDGSLRAVFRTVPACQHAVRDADDGTARPNG